MKEHVLQESLDLVALQETIKQDFEDWELKEMSGNKEFNWIWVPARGHFGGLLTSVNIEGFEIEHSVLEQFFVGVLIRNREINFRFWVLNVYGPAHHDISRDFIK